MSSSPTLVTNPLSYYWHQENLRGHPRRQRSLYATYLTGMVGYGVAIAKRVVEIAYCALRIVASFFCLLACRGQLFRSELHKWTIGLFGAFAWTGSAFTGTVCPPLAYHLDERLYRHPILRQTLWTDIKMDRDNEETLARWDLQTTIGYFTQAIIQLDNAEKTLEEDGFQRMLRNVGLFLAMRDADARNELLLFGIDTSDLYKKYHEIRGTPSWWDRLSKEPRYSDQDLLDSLVALVDNDNATNAIAKPLFAILQRLTNELVYEQRAADTVLLQDASAAIPYLFDGLKPYVEEARTHIVDGALAARLTMCFLVASLKDTYRLYPEERQTLKGHLENAHTHVLAGRISKRRMIEIYTGKPLADAEIPFTIAIDALAQAYLEENQRIFDGFFYDSPFSRLKDYIVQAMSLALQEQDALPVKDVVAKLALFLIVRQLKPPYKVDQEYKDLITKALSQRENLTPPQAARALLRSEETEFLQTLSELAKVFRNRQGAEFDRLYNDARGPVRSPREKS